MTTRVSALVVVAACGRIGFNPHGGDARDDGGIAVDDAIAIDGQTVVGGCDMPVQIGTIDMQGVFAAASATTSYRVTWIDHANVVHLLGIERDVDTIMTSERTFVGDAFLGTPSGASVAFVGTLTVLDVVGTTASELTVFTGPQIQTKMSTGYNNPARGIAASGASAYILVDTNKLNVQAFDPASNAFGGLTVLDMNNPAAAVLAAGPSGDVLAVMAHTTQNDCAVKMYAPNFSPMLLGSSSLPGDGTKCNPIAGAYAPMSDQSLVVYAYNATMPELHVQPITSTAQPSGAFTVLPGLIDVSVGTAGSTFFVAYNSSARPITYALAHVDGSAAVLAQGNLHFDTSEIDYAVVASGAGEAVAFYALHGTPDQLWMRRLCGP